jgi:FkbM family methyltransferase
MNIAAGLGQFATPQFEHGYAGRSDKRTAARFLARLLAGTDLFIDVGAHDGFFSLLAARHNPALEIVATEPDAALCEILRKNVALARHDKIEVRQVAVSSKAYAVKDGIATQPDPDTPPIEHTDIEAVSIERLLRGRRARRLVVRIDAGQHVPAVLAEMGKLEGRGLDLRLLVEVDQERQPPTSIALEKLLAELDRLGFVVVLIDDEQDRFYRVRPDSEPRAQVARYANLYCVPKDRALSVVFFAHSVRAGGGERSLMELVDALVADHGIICTVVSPAPAGALVDRVTRSGAAVVVADLPWWGASPNDKAQTTIRTDLVRGIRDICRTLLPVLEKVDPDVVFTQSMVIPWGAFAAEVLEKPHAWHVCEFGELDYGLWFSDPFADILAAIATGSSFIFTAVDAIRTTLFSGFDQKRIRTIYRHIPIPDNVRPADDAYFRAGAVRLGLFGTLFEGKGQHEAVQAVAELVRRGRNVELLLAGSTVFFDRYRARIDRLVEELALGERVRIAGFFEDPYPAMAAADICLVCSRNEAFGRVAAEAMLLGLPVVYARSGGVAEYMEEGVTGLAYTPGDINGLVDGIEALIDDPARAAAIGAAAQRHAREKFTRNGYSGEVFRILLGLRGMAPEVGTPRRVVKAMAEAISADAAQLAELRAAVSEAQNALTQVQAHLSALETSTSWRLTRQLRLFLAPHPRLCRIIRGALKLAWWIVTLQLPRRLRNRWSKMLTAPDYFSAQPLTPEQEATFFSELRLANGVFKITTDHRMDDLNEVVLSRWHATAFRPKEIMDVGVSSGISTVEWLETLSGAGLKVHMIGTDVSLSAHIVPLWPGAYALKTTDGHVLRIFGPTIEGWKNRRGYPTLRRLAYRAAARRCSRRKKLLLLSPRALRCDAIEWAEDDVLSPNPTQFLRRFDVIRAANILNLCYFNGDQLRCAVANLKERLAGPGARLIVNRTWNEDGSNHATMFLLTEAGFDVEARLGQGSEIEDVVLGGRE